MTLLKLQNFKLKDKTIANKVLSNYFLVSTPSQWVILPYFHCMLPLPHVRGGPPSCEGEEACNGNTVNLLPPNPTTRWLYYIFSFVKFIKYFYLLSQKNKINKDIVKVQIRLIKLHWHYWNFKILNWKIKPLLTGY